MQLVQLIVQNDAAHAIVSKLGEMGKMQLRDVSRSPSSPLARPCLLNICPWGGDAGTHLERAHGPPMLTWACLSYS
jgi:hypothetical protein